MDGCTISHAAARTGFSTSALRFYEDHELVRPQRSAAGYRVYADADIERLQFIRRAKGFGLTLDEITEVLPLLDDDACAPVQDRLRSLVDQKIDDAHVQVAELVAFTAELLRAAGALRRPAPEGPCDRDCGCVAEPAATPPVACTLAPEHVAGRVADWESVLDRSIAREPLPDGVRVHFGPTVDAAELARLAADEQGCCSFFTFRLTLTPEGVSLEVTGPPDARPVIDALVGVAA